MSVCGYKQTFSRSKLLNPKVTQEQIAAEAQRVPGVKDVQLLVHPWPSVLTGAAAAP